MQSDIRARLLEIEQAIASDTYKTGRWQHLIADIESLSDADRQALSEDVSRTSRALHRRHGFPELPFIVGWLGEIAMFVAALVLLQIDQLLAALVGSAALALCLQPLIKTAVGLVLGVRYDYTYLWYFEPRFKMRYGSYVCLPGGKRVLFHLAGSIGTPVALFVAWRVLLPINEWLALLALIGAILAIALQVGAFAAEWYGVRKIGTFRLSLLTSPATAAMELRKPR